MKLEWCPETAGKAYIDAVELLSPSHAASGSNTDVAELVAAMAGGWQAQCIVEATWLDNSTASTSSAEYFTSTSPLTTSIALAAAARRTGGRHVFIVPNDQERDEYLRGIRQAASPEAAEAIEVIVGDAWTVVAGIQGVDFAVVDCRRGDASSVLSSLRPGHRGAVVVCEEAARTTTSPSGREEWKGVFMPGARVVRATVLPLGHTGIEVVHVGVGKGPSLWDDNNGRSARWFKHFDPITGEEHIFRR